MGSVDQSSFSRSSSRWATKSARLIAGFGNAHAGVEIGAFEVSVDGNDAVAGARQRGSEVGNDKALAHPPFAAANGNQTCAVAGRHRIRAQFWLRWSSASLALAGRSHTSPAADGSSPGSSGGSVALLRRCSGMVATRCSARMEPMWFISGVHLGLGRNRVWRRSRACCGVRPPLRRLQSTQLQTTFSQVVRPPSERGIYVIEIELRALGPLAAVLTGELVTGEDVDPAVADVALRHPVEPRKQDHSGYADRTARRAHRCAALGNPPPSPAIEVECLVRLVDDSRDISVDQRERPPCRSHVDRQVRAIEYENG